MQATQTLKGTIPLTAQDLNDALKLHTGQKPAAEMEPIKLSTRVLLVTLKDKHDDIKYKVKLTADITVIITPTTASRWCAFVSACRVSSGIDKKLMFC